LNVPTVSVVMPVRNGIPYLAEAVDSILGQTFSDFEFLIADDASTDSTPDVLAEYCSKDSRVRVLGQEQPDYMGALTRACAEARGRYIARMDADDVALPDRLDREVAVLESRPALAVVGTQTTLIDNSGRAFGYKGYPVGSQAIKEMLLEKNCMAHPTAVIRREHFASVGGYRRAFAASQDYDLWLRLAERYQLDNLPQPLMSRRIHDAQVAEDRLDTQVLCSLAARAAAVIRRKTGCDPLEGATRIGREVLADMGVGPVQVQQRMVRQLLGRARDNYNAGYVEAALANAEAALGMARKHAGHPRWVAKAHKARARILWREGRRGAAAAACMRSSAWYLRAAADFLLPTPKEDT
jgi:glycosyltransferase involved in cell wall biosynthesis